MAEPITHYGIENASSVMSAFHKVGNDQLAELLELYSAPAMMKTLRTWGLREAAPLIGRSEQHIRKLEEIGGPLYPHLKDAKNKRYYTLERINQFRDKLGTRYKRDKLSDTMIFAVSNFKGGVGKSSSSLAFSHKCALEGLRVLCIDLDPQATLTLGFGFIPDVHLKGEDTISKALNESPTCISSLIQKTYFDGISLIPGNLALSDMELELINSDKQKRDILKLGMPQERLKNALSLVKDQYDIIILDCGPNLGILTINALTAANALLVPIPPMMPDFGSYVTFTGTLAELFKSINKDFVFFRILLTKHSGSQEADGIATMMRQRFGRYMLINSIVNSVEIEKASSKFGSVYELPKNSSPTYRRAITTLDLVFNEILDACKTIWKAQAIAKNKPGLADKNTHILEKDHGR
jgi:chromosome partitioning protein